jgi:peroxiredoxin
MKTGFFISTLLLLLMISCAHQKKATIRGTISSSYDDEKIYLEELRITNNDLIDSARIRKNGKFTCSVKLNTPGFYELVLTDGPSLSLILSPGEDIVLTADRNNFYTSKHIEGSANSIRVNMLHDSLRSTIAKLDKIRDEYSALKGNDNELKRKQNELEEQFLLIKKEYHKFSVGFILDDLSSLANIAALYQEYAPDEYVFRSSRDIQFFKLVSDSLTKYYPDVRYVKALRENYQVLFNDYSTRRLLQDTKPISYDIPELYLPDPDGRMIALSSLKGKLVLLIFWSVNQPESIRNMLELKDVYKKYHKKGFEIYQVSVDNSLENWKRTIAFEEIPWISVCDTAFPASQTRSLYNVNSLPMNYLIDKQQKEILAKNITSENLDKSILYLSNN